MAFFKKINFSFTWPILFLAVFSLLTLASLSAGDGRPFLTAQKQAIWYLVGFAAFFAFAKFFDYRWLRDSNFFSVGFYLAGLTLLGITAFWGIEAKGAVGWIGFSFMRFQPAELAKLALIVLLSRYFALWHIEIWRPRRLLVTAVYTGLYFILTFIQPDLGSAVVFLAIWLAMLLVSGMKFRHFLVLLIIGCVLAGLGWQNVLKPYQKERVLNFFNPAHDPLGAGYNVNQAKIAIGSGGWFGRGLGQGVETQMKFLPEAKTDFFFSAFVEEWGIVGGLILCAIIFVFFFQTASIGLRVRDNFSRLFIFGYLACLGFQIFVNIGANLGYLPVTGLPLPFLSYGGSNLLINFCGLGIIQSIRAKNA